MTRGLIGSLNWYSSARSASACVSKNDAGVGDASIGDPCGDFGDHSGLIGLGNGDSGDTLRSTGEIGEGCGLPIGLPKGDGRGLMSPSVNCSHIHFARRRSIASGSSPKYCQSTPMPD
jgi:hypothetical protein